MKTLNFSHFLYRFLSKTTFPPLFLASGWAYSPYLISYLAFDLNKINDSLLTRVFTITKFTTEFYQNFILQNFIRILILVLNRFVLFYFLHRRGDSTLLTIKMLIKSGFLGMGLCFISSFLLSLGTMMVSRMNQFHPITKSFWRFAGTFCPAVFVVFYYAFKKESITSSFWPLRKQTLIVLISLVFRSFFGCTAATLQYYSLKYMPLGDSSVICNSYPVFVTILAYLFLGEPFGGIFMFFSTLMTFGGVILITRPPLLTGDSFDTEILIGAGLALGCAVFMAMAIVMIRHLKEIHHCITLVGFGGFGTIEAALLTWGFDVMEFPTETMDILMAVAIGLLSCGSQMFLIFALKCDNAGPVALVKTTDVLFAFLWQMIFLKIFPDYISIIGGIVMMSGIFLCGFKKYIDSLEEAHSKRKLFWFVLK